MIKISSYILFFGAIVAIALLLISFQYNNVDVKNTVKATYKKDNEAFVVAVKLFTEKVRKFRSYEVDINELKEQYIQVRLKFKTIELLSEYLEPDFVKDFINGPPLMHLERNSPQLSEIEPEGIQVIEEVLYSDNLNSNEVAKEELEQLSNKLERRVEEFVRFQSYVRLTDRHVFEAIQLEIIRIVTLGLTGFDTPKSENFITDAESSLRSIETYYSIYAKEIMIKNESLKMSIDQTITQSIAYLLKNQNSETFDRIHLIREFLDPLYGYMISSQELLHIETIYETTPVKQSLNYKARSMFSKDFLNKYYYTALLEKENSFKKEELGKLLFFDPILSGSNDRSCASCHKPELAFTDGLPKSIALNHDGTVERNSPTLINSVYSDRYFYDLRADVLESQLEHVVVSDKEFNTTFEEITSKLESIQEYQDLFTSIYPNGNGNVITKIRIQELLSSYVSSLTSFNSEFDKFMRKEKTNFSKSAYRGANLFLGKAACGTCHFLPLFNGSVPPLYREMESEVLGVPLNPQAKRLQIDPDVGRYAGQLKERSKIYNHSFKTVTVRNSKVTAPYMHNGIYKTLEEILDFYNNGGGVGLKLEVSNQTLPADSLGLTKSEIKDIVSFLNSLTDFDSMKSKPKKLPKHSNPNHLLNQRKMGGIY